MTSLAMVSLLGYFVRRRRLNLEAIPAPIFKSVEMHWARESMGSKTSPWISKHLNILASDAEAFERLGHSWSSLGSSVLESLVTMVLNALRGVRERPSAWSVGFSRPMHYIIVEGSKFFRPADG